MTRERTMEMASRVGVTKRKVALVTEVGVRFGYTHFMDLGEFLVQQGFDVSLVMPYTEDLEEWNKGRGFTFDFMPKASRTALPGLSNFRYNCEAYRRSRDADCVIVMSQPTLLLGIMLSLFGKRVVYYPAELSLFATRGGGSFSILEKTLPYLPIKVFTTGLHRSRVLAQAVKAKSVPGEIPIAAMRTTSTVVSFADTPIADRIRALAGNPDGIVVLCNGGLHEANCLDLILEAAIPASSGVLIGMIGPLAPQWPARIAAANAKTGNYFYLGALPGNRYDIISAIKGVDLGFVLKPLQAYQTYNDRLYTPTKLYDFVANGTPVVCSAQATLNFVRHEGIGFQLSELSAASIRAFLMSLPERRGELREMSARVRARFETTHNFEAGARDLLAVLK